MSAVLEFFKKPFLRKHANYMIIGLVTVLFGLLSATGQHHRQ